MLGQIEISILHKVKCATLDCFNFIKRTNKQKNNVTFLSFEFHFFQIFF